MPGSQLQGHINAMSDMREGLDGLDTLLQVVEARPLDSQADVAEMLRRAADVRFAPVVETSFFRAKDQ